MRFTWQADQVESCKYLKPALLLNAGLLANLYSRITLCYTLS